MNLMIFFEHKFDISCIKIEWCQIDLISDIPLNLRPFICSIRDQELLQKKIDLLLEHKLTQPSIFSYSAQVALVNKKMKEESLG